MEVPERYLCFNLGSEDYAIPLRAIKEVIGVPETTPIPQSPAYFVGIMNLRGQIISIMDLRKKLSIVAKKTEETAVIILEFGRSSLGVVVDRVDSVQIVSPEEISDKPDLGMSSQTEHINGVYRKNEKLILILDVARALSLEDKAAIQAVPKSA